MSKFVDSIKSIFKRGRGGKEDVMQELPFDRLLGLSLGNALDRLARGGAVELSPAPFAELCEEALRGGEFVTLNYFCELDNSLISYIYPERYIALLNSFTPPPADRQVDYDLLESASLRLVPAIYGGLNYFKGIKQYKKGGLEPLFLTISGNQNFRVEVGGQHFYISVNQKFYKNINERLKAEKTFELVKNKLQGAVRPKSRAEQACLEKSGESYYFKIGSPQEFGFSSLLMPNRFFPEGGAAFRALRLSSAPAEQEEMLGLSVALSITIDEHRFRLVYRFAGLGRKFFSERGLESGDFFKALFAQLKEEICRVKRESRVVIEYKLLESPLPPGAGVALQLEGLLSIGGEGFKVFVSAETGYALQLSKALLTSMESGYLLHSGNRFEPANRVLALVLTLNQHLLRRRVGIGCEEGALFEDSLLFSDLAAMLDDDDLRLLIQNFLIPRYSIEFIKSLFKYRVAEEGEPLNIMLGEKRVIALLPPFTLEEYRKRPVVTGNLEQLITNNRAFLKALLEAVRKSRLALSARGNYIITRTVFHELESGVRKVFDSLVEQDLPFTLMKKLAPRELEIFLRSIGNLDYCRLFIGSEHHFDHFIDFIPGKRKQIIREDYAFIMGQYNAGKIPYEQLIENRRTIRQKAERYLARLEREKKVIQFDLF